MTVLRDPIYRVLSLFRFWRMQPDSELAATGLRQNFSIEEFLETNARVAVNEITNGMCFFLGGDSEEGGLVTERDQATLYERALKNLGLIKVAFSDELAVTINEWGKEWGLPFDLRLPTDNVTSNMEIPVPHNVHLEILRRNSADLALYEFARFRSARAHWNQRSVFRVILGTATPVAEVCGKVGFHDTENGVAWIREGGCGEINCISEGLTCTIALGIYAVTDGYSPDDLKITVNGLEIRYAIEQLDARNYALSFKQSLLPGLNRITILPEVFLSAAELYAGTGDNRKLAIALKTLSFY